jgi:hypothetical protein
MIIVLNKLPVKSPPSVYIDNETPGVFSYLKESAERYPDKPYAWTAALPGLTRRFVPDFRL